MNVCLAASIGLSAWAFSMPQDKEQRYSYGAESPGLRLLHSIEDTFSQLTTVQICALFSTSFILIGVFCTGSRGAAISAIVASIVALLASQSKKNGVGVWIFAIFAVAIGLTGIYFFELNERITGRFSELARADALQSDIQIGRLYIWSIAIKALTFFGVFGSGLGTFHYAHLPFQDPTSVGWYYHAENLYLQVLVELGWFGAIGILAVVGLTARSLKLLAKPQKKLVGARLRDEASQFHSLFLAGMTLAICQAVHSVFDFALIVPAVFLPASLLIGMVYGASKNRMRVEPRSSELQPETSSARTQSQRLPKIEGSRFTTFVEQPTPATLASNPIRFKATSILLTGCVCVLFLLSGSLRPIEAMCHVDLMNRWLDNQSKVARASRIGSPSAYLAGLWGRPSIPVYQVPDALRILGESVIYEFRSQRIDDFEAIPGEKLSVTWEKTSPLLLRLGVAEKEAEASAKGIDVEAFEKSAGFDTLMGGPKQLARWNKARELIERAHLQSPLDWRLTWGRLLLDRKLNVSEWNGWFDRSTLVSRHRPETLFQIGVLGWQAANDREHVYTTWERAMRLNPSLAPSAASIIAMETQESDVPIDIFPANPYYLSLIAATPFDELRFPLTNSKLWEKIGTTALELKQDDPYRYTWLAAAAAHFGETEKEIEFLGESVNLMPMNRELRMKLADRLAAAGMFESAVENAEICRSMAPDDPQIDASLKRLKTLAADAKRKE